MPSYVVTGASRGLGLEFVHQLSQNPENQVFAIVRNKETSKSLALSNGNVFILQADIVDHQALKAAAAQVSKHTGGKLDVLINNAAFIESVNAGLPLTAFENREDVLEKDLRNSFNVNVIGVIHTINAFLPLLRAGTVKKVITISTGIADPEMLEKSGLYVAAPYGISKAGTNMVVTKYAIQFRDEGLIFLALSPGLVETLGRERTTEELVEYEAMIRMFQRVKPIFEGAITPEESVKAQLEVIAGVTIKDTGSFISHHGNKDWL
ncbi:NAD(P)-binding protein [Ramaria rubella]|nr:NAD(P)-binding protein [Ramaria rubella]